MGDGQRWSVTYTNQITKKRAVYQDGFLELQSSHRKVMLYDEYDKLLGSRFVKNEDVIESGKTLAFDSYRVDIGDECGCSKPLSTFNGQEKDKKVGVKSGNSHGSLNNSLSIDRKPTFGRNKARGINLSPSRRIIRDFNRSEMEKYSSSTSSTDIAKCSTIVWQVLYTTQITQKAKKFYDGFLHLVVRHGSLGRQVMLYDEYGKVMGSRFVKKEEVIKSGERVTFDSFLVDVGDEYCGNIPVSTLNCQAKDKKAAGKSGSTYSHESQNNVTTVDRKPIFRRNSTQVITISPSQEIIRDFKKSQMDKYVSSPSCLDQKNPITLEWQVMYTTQVTQKAKRFHDGFLQLVVHGGSQGRQVALLAEDGLSLGRRYLKSYEDVKTGTTIELPNYLVEIGQSRDDASTKRDSEVEASGMDNMILSRRVRTTMPLCNGKTQSKTSPKKVTIFDGSNSKEEDVKLTSKAISNEPRRAAHDILSILRKPTIQANVLMMNKPLVEEPLETHSSVAHSDKENYGQDCSRITEDELRERTFIHDCSAKIVKSEAVELLNDEEKCEVSGNRREILAGSSNFCFRSGAKNSVKRDLNAECADHIELVLCSPDVEEHKLVPPALDEVQTQVASPLLNRLNKKIKLENTSDVTSHSAAAETIDLSSSKLLEVRDDNQGSCSRGHEGASTVSTVASSDWTSHDVFDAGDKTLEQAFYTTDMDEFPSFDLGF